MGIGQYYDDEESRIGLEMISPQLGDTVVKELEKAYSDISKRYDTYKHDFKTSISFFDDEKMLKLIKELDNIILNRFGIVIKHINSEWSPYSVLTTPPPNTNVLSGDVKKRAQTIAREARLRSRKLECNKGTGKLCKVKNITDIDDDHSAVVMNITNSFSKINKTLNADGIKFNLNDATIKGLPESYVTFMLVNMKDLIEEYKLTPLELTAVLLHEVGHIFTHLEYSYRTVKTTSVIADTIQSELAKGSDTNRIMHLIYEEVLEGDSGDLGGNDNVATVKVLDRFMKKTLKIHTDDNHSFTDSEQLADQFSSKFGLGGEIVTAVDKMMNYRPPIYTDSIIYNILLTLMLLLMSVNIIVGIILYFIVNTVVMFFIGGRDSREKTYDKSSVRYKRIRSDMIKTIRMSGNDKKYNRILLDEIAKIDDIIDNIMLETGPIEKFMDRMLPWNRSESNFKFFEQLMEDMLENDLHLSSAKLKNIGSYNG